MTSAAVIMVAVFSIFATLSVIEFKVFGVGHGGRRCSSTPPWSAACCCRPALALLGDRVWPQKRKQAA